MNCKDCIHNEVCYRREVCNDIEEHIRKLGCMDFIARADVQGGRYGLRKKKKKNGRQLPREREQK